MKPKEKAIELVNKYWDLNLGWSKCCQCALIAVNYLIDDEEMWQNGEPNPIYYWKEVKQEIENL